MSTVVVITGPSGVGKGTLIRRLMAQLSDFELSISATTRQPRAGERNGVDYWFLTDQEFQQKVAENQFVEHATYSGASYGTLRTEIDSRLNQGASVILEIEVQGARQLRKTLSQAMQIFVAPPSISDLETRLTKRATESKEQIKQRLKVAKQELAAQNEFTHVLVNDNLKYATEELVNLVQATMATP